MKRTKKGYELDGVLLEPLAREYGTPLAVISQSQILNMSNSMKKAFSYPNTLFLFANKSLRLVAIQRLLINNGHGIQAGSIGEMYLGLLAGCPPEKMRTTQNFQDEKYLLYAIGHGIKPYLDSFEDIERFRHLMKKERVPGNYAVGIRINPGVGDGEDPGHTVTGGPQSEFGIYHTLVDRIIREARKKPEINLDSLEMHIGSNFKYADRYLYCFDRLLEVALYFENQGIPINEISGGGGKGRAYQTNEKDLNISSFGEQIDMRIGEYAENINKEPLLIFEDGRYYVVDGLLLTEVGSIKRNPNQPPQAIINAGIPQVLRIPMYDAVHPFYNISRPFGKNRHVTMKGNDCEHVVLSHDVFIGEPHIGDIVGVGNATAYCIASMESEYGGKPQCPVLLLNRGQVDVIRKGGELSDLTRNEIIPERLGGRLLDMA